MPPQARPLYDRWAEKVDFDGPDGCWVWTGFTDRQGYGRINSQARPVPHQEFTHRLAYMMVKGEIPTGFQIDHLCRNRSCCNPDHLEAVTPAENNRRSQSSSAKRARQTHCFLGHPLEGDNLKITVRGHRQCRSCMQRRDRTRRATRVAVAS